MNKNDSWHIARIGKRFRKSQSEVEFTEKPDWLHGGGRLICEVCKSADAPADSYLDRWDETTLWKYYRHSTLEIRWSARYTGPALQMMLNARRKRQSKACCRLWTSCVMSTDLYLYRERSTLLAGTVKGSVRSEELLPNHSSFITGGDNPPKHASPYKWKL